MKACLLKASYLDV
jgi:hypothetical protein